MIKNLLTILYDRGSFGKALSFSFIAGLLTIFTVIYLPKSNHPGIWGVANFLGSPGNDVFLIATNGLILVWAWRKQLRSIMVLTLWLDFMVWLMVQGMKVLAVGSWSLRPNGSPGGFPSGHATHAFGMAFLLTLFFPRFAWIWYSCAAAISWSRVETDFHSGVQVTAGIILGLGIGCILVSKWYGHIEAAGFKLISRDHSLVQPTHRPYAAE